MRAGGSRKRCVLASAPLPQHVIKPGGGGKEAHLLSLLCCPTQQILMLTLTEKSWFYFNVERIKIGEMVPLQHELTPLHSLIK